ncbi:MAG: ROK family protein [Clostridia bacterium]|nr:ROK family protein [Clostridia bacterium]
MLYLGIDLGGTNIAAGIVDDKGRILRKDSTPTILSRPIEEIVGDMAELCRRLVKEEGLTMDDIAAIGLGSPGTVDNKNGVIVYSNNIPMKNIPMRKMLEEHFPGKPINLENDANAAAYGEYIVNGNNAESFVFITLGTGVGGGVIINGKLYRGFNSAGGELGHITLISGGEPCTCGKNGCWESYASVTALIRQTKAAMAANPESVMNEWSEKNGKVSGRTAFDCAKEGDKTAKEVVKQYAIYVADGLSSIINIFQPEKLSIGGGISKEGDYLLDPIKEFLAENDYNKYMPKTKVEIATLFNDAGIIGAALSEA